MKDNIISLLTDKKNRRYRITVLIYHKRNFKTLLARSFFTYQKNVMICTESRFALDSFFCQKCKNYFDMDFIYTYKNEIINENATYAAFVISFTTNVCDRSAVKPLTNAIDFLICLWRNWNASSCFLLQKVHNTQG